MKLITHNMLTSKCVKGVVHGYPLALSATELRRVPVDFDAEFVTRLIPKVDWAVLVAAASSLGHAELPAAAPPDYEADTEFLRAAHGALLELEVLEGQLVCPETGRAFPISRGIPNMLLTEAEV